MIGLPEGQPLFALADPVVGETRKTTLVEGDRRPGATAVVEPAAVNGGDQAEERERQERPGHPGEAAGKRHRDGRGHQRQARAAQPDVLPFAHGKHGTALGEPGAVETFDVRGLRVGRDGWLGDRHEISLSRFTCLVEAPRRAA